MKLGLSMRPGFEQFHGWGQDHFRTDQFHTAVILLAGLFLAGATIHLDPYYAFAVKEGISPGGVCRAENRNDRNTKGGSEMAWAGVVADHKTAAANQGLQLSNGNIVLGKVHG